MLSHQKELHEDESSKIILLSSGFGAGKSHALCMKLLKLSYINNGASGGILCPSYVDYKKDIYPLFVSILEDNKIKYYYHKTESYFVFPWNKGKLYALSAEKKLRGLNLGYMGLNEAGLISYERFKESLGRVRVKNLTCPQTVLVSTPTGISHWTYEHFVENPRPGTRIIYGNTKDNPHLDPTYISMLEQNYDKKMLDAYLLGKFVNMNGAQFYYAFDRRFNLDDTLVYNKDHQVLCAMDFNVDLHTCTLWQHIGNVYRCFDEIVMNNSTTEKMCDALEARGFNPSNTTIFPDPAGNARTTAGLGDIQILKNREYLVRFKPKAPSFRQRQLCVNNLLDKKRIKVNPINCKTMVRDFEGVEQDAGDFSKVKKNPKLTHASDGIDYLFDILEPLSGNRPQVRNERIR